MAPLTDLVSEFFDGNAGDLPRLVFLNKPRHCTGNPGLNEVGRLGAPSIAMEAEFLFSDRLMESSLGR